MKTRLMILSLICFFLLVSCKEDDYVYPNVLTEFIDVQTDDTGTITYLVADNGSRYAVQPREGLDGLKADTLYRTISIYEFLSAESAENEAEVILYSSYQVLSPDPIATSDFKDSIYTDPVDIQSIWLSGNYLNMILQVHRKDQTHTFQFLKDDTTCTSPTGRILCLLLYHNSHNDYEAFTDPVYLSVPLRHLQLESGDSIRFYLNTYKEGTTYREFCY